MPAWHIHTCGIYRPNKLSKHRTVSIGRKPGPLNLIPVKGLDLFCSFVQASDKPLVYPAAGPIKLCLCDFQRFGGQLGRIKAVYVVYQGLVFVFSNICQDFIDSLHIAGLEGKVPV